MNVVTQRLHAVGKQDGVAFYRLIARAVAQRPAICTVAVCWRLAVAKSAQAGKPVLSHQLLALLTIGGQGKLELPNEHTSQRIVCLAGTGLGRTVQGHIVIARIF